MRKNPTIAEDLIVGFTELADALETGTDIGKRFNCYTKQLDLRPKTYTPEMVRQARKRLGASQSVFARFLGVSPKSVSQWERGVSQPSSTACRFMDEIRRNSSYYVKRLRESMVPKDGRNKKLV
jgi:putative transcriptional regulator